MAQVTTLLIVKYLVIFHPPLLEKKLLKEYFHLD